MRASLEAYSNADDNPKEWASAQVSLAGIIGLRGLLALARGGNGTELLAQAEAADRAALQLLTRKEYPDEWASAEGDLAINLAAHADAASGSRSLELYAQAAAAFRDVLEVRDQQKDRLKKANTLESLAHLLSNQAARTTGSQAAELLAQSIAASRAELDIFTITEFPQRWARIQSDLGEALALQGAQAAGAQSTELLSQAATAYLAALQVFTKEDYPSRWARVQSHLAGVLATQGQRATVGQSVLFTQATAAYRHALEVLTRQDYPQDWAYTQFQLGRLLGMQASVDAAQSAELLTQAIEAYRVALEVYTRSEDPREWTAAQTNIGQLLVTQGRRLSGDESDDCFSRAAAAYSAALEADPKNPSILSAISTLYHEYLTDFAKAYELTVRLEAADPSDENRLNLAEAELTTSHFSDCVDLLSSMDPARMKSAEEPSRQTLLFACQFGLGQQKQAAETAGSFSRFAAGLPKGGWTTTGDRIYFATAPQFASGRSSWIKLFQSLQDSDGLSMAEAAHSLRDLIGN